MTIDRFEVLLSDCTKASLQVARSMVVESLPDEVRYQKIGERGRLVGPTLKHREFTEEFFRDGRIPRWVDLTVTDAAESFTIVGFYHSNDLVEEEARCVYANRDQGPFGIKSPRLPFDWKSVAESGRFSLKRKKANEPVETTQAVVRSPVRQSGTISRSLAAASHL